MIKIFFNVSSKLTRIHQQYCRMEALKIKHTNPNAKFGFSIIYLVINFKNINLKNEEEKNVWKNVFNKKIKDKTYVSIMFALKKNQTRLCV